MGFFRRWGKVYKPKEDVKLGSHSDEIYIHANVKAPRMAGFLVKLCVWILESRLIGFIVVYILKRDNLIHKLVSFITINEPPLFLPNHIQEANDKMMESELSTPLERVAQIVHCLPAKSDITQMPTFKYKRWTIQDYSRAYFARNTTPTEVAEKFLAAVKKSLSPPLEMGFFISYNDEDILKQAAQSTLRYKKGRPMSILDGVLIAVKDEIDCLPYPTTGGTKWLHKHRKCEEDARCVQHLRSCGAILVGKTNMHELGAGTSGINPHYGVAKNPYDINKITGGSSSGSAAVVCAGLCPAALGVDGGGSVRMPASLCGVVGLKPTFGSISHSGVLPFNWTVGMVGILAGTVEDACIVQAAISEHLSKPPASLPFLNSVNGTVGIKLAKSAEWFNDCNEEIRTCCDQALSMLSSHYGWKTIDVTVPEIEEMRLAHYTTIGAECTTSLSPYLEKIEISELGWDARVALRIYGSFSSQEYLNAQRLRNRQMYFHGEIFKLADAIVTPTTGVTAYPIHNDALKTGELDYINGAALVRYQIAGNFLGLPAVTVPIGYDKLGMPIGLQFIGKPWSEATLLQLAYAIQELCKERYKKPQIFYNLLEENVKACNESTKKL